EGGRIVQCGTPQQIFTNPATDYVAEFVAHMNPLAVLRAEDVMQPGAPAGNGPVVRPSTPLREVMQALQQAGDTAIGVQDEAGRMLGHITRADVLAGLLDPRGTGSAAR
ncbi:MAG: choline ABC transporter ATP-binding protein, partial [Paracoccaceae bacterium]|nr:choline ABC transporter ATP-binding protein [Paracoccaceae bacterium]